MRISIVNTLSLICIVLILIASYEARKIDYPIRILPLIICWFSMVYFPHCLAHYIVGRLFGVEFSHYTLSRSMLSKSGIPIISRMFSVRVFLTLRIKRRARRGMFPMFISGPIASMLSPLAVVYITYTYDKTSANILAILTILNIVFSGYFSYRNGCIRKAINSLKS